MSALVESPYPRKRTFAVQMRMCGPENLFEKRRSHQLRWPPYNSRENAFYFFDLLACGHFVMSATFFPFGQYPKLGLSFFLANASCVTIKLIASTIAPTKIFSMVRPFSEWRLILVA